MDNENFTCTNDNCMVFYRCKWWKATANNAYMNPWENLVETQNDCDDFAPFDRGDTK